jgi:organic radical activating enzyme
MDNLKFAQQVCARKMNPSVFSIKSAEYPSGNSNLDGISLDIFFYGCLRPEGHCSGCHNEELWKFIQPNKSWEQLIKTINKAEKAYVITLLGGDPIDSMGEYLTESLLVDIKLRTDKKTCIYTYRDISDVPRGILEQLDYVKTGFYDETRKTPAGSFLASENQIMWKKNKEGGWFMQWVMNGRNNSTKSW